MPCVETPCRPVPARRWPLLVWAALAGGCGSGVAPGSPAAAGGQGLAATTGSIAGGPAAIAANPTASGAEPATATRPASADQSARAATPPLTPQRAARHWADFQQLAAQRLVEANPGGTYGGPVPEPLLAIPVLEIELNGDGSVRRILVMRQPRQALDTVQLAIAAVHRAAPFGAVSHLPRPWKFTEVFLFDEQRRFKPRTLDL